MVEGQPEEALAPGSGGRRKLSPVVVIGVVIVLAMGAAAAVMIMGAGRGPKYVDPGAREVHPTRWLDIPTVEVKDVPLSVALDSTGSQRKALTVGVSIRFAPPEGEAPDVKRLLKEFIPRVTSLKAEFRSIIIEQMSSKDYGKLSNTEVRNQLLKTFQQEFDKKLRKYGLRKMARVHEVMWKDFYWS